MSDTHKQSKLAHRHVNGRAHELEELFDDLASPVKEYASTRLRSRRRHWPLARSTHGCHRLYVYPLKPEGSMKSVEAPRRGSPPLPDDVISAVSKSEMQQLRTVNRSIARTRHAVVVSGINWQA
jgi:hypothetical protein